MAKPHRREAREDVGGDGILPKTSAGVNHVRRACGFDEKYATVSREGSASGEGRRNWSELLVDGKAHSQR